RRHTSAKRDWSSDVCSSDLGELSSPIGRIGSENGEVKNDGTITIDYPLDDDFFERYKGEKVEVKIEIKGSTFQENVVEAYGKQRSEERRVGKEGREWRGRGQ